MTTSDSNTPKKGSTDNFDYRSFMAKYGGVTLAKCHGDTIVYAQGDPVEAVFYIVSGSVKISVLSDQGKGCFISFLGPGDFFGEGCLDGRPWRASTITTTSVCEIARFSRAIIRRALAEGTAFCQMFFRRLLARNEILKTDLLDQLFYSSEKRLARILLTLANTAPGDGSRVISTPVTQDALAQVVSTTRAHQLVHARVPQARLHRLQRRDSRARDAIQRHRRSSARQRRQAITTSVLASRQSVPGY
jgi:CRP/FNR family cyclic AMP-dependent transcriptional regulator